MKEKSFWRKKELIEAALDEFSTHSYQNASLNRIIKNAGISKGKFYYRFEDKKAFYLFLQESAYKEQLEFQDKRMKELAGDPQKSKDFWDRRKCNFLGPECEAFEDPENGVFEGQKLDFFEKIRLRAQIGAECAIRFPKYTKFTIMLLNEKENEDTKEIIEYINGFVKKTVETRVEEMVTEGFEAGDLSDRFSKDFIITIVSHLLFHSTEIFGIGEEFNESKLLDDTTKLIEFLKFGLSR